MAANQDNQSEKNKLVPLNPSQVDNYNATGADFPSTGKGSDLIPSGKPYGYAEGKDKLVDAPEGNRNLEDSGDMTPSVWGKGGKAFTVQTNSGESNSSASSVSYMNSVNLVTGMMDGGSPTKVGEVVDMNVRIPNKA
jgi:hypothetical protein